MKLSTAASRAESDPVIVAENISSDSNGISPGSTGTIPQDHSEFHGGELDGYSMCSSFSTFQLHKSGRVLLTHKTW